MNCIKAKVNRQRTACYLLLSFALSLLFPLLMLAQNSITGTIKNATGHNLSGVIITHKGSGNAVTSDTTGQFAISVPANTILDFSSVGYLPQELFVGSQTAVNVTLQAADNTLEHVDGVSLAPLLKRKKTLDRKALYWQFPHYSNHGLQSPGVPSAMATTNCSSISRMAPCSILT